VAKGQVEFPFDAVKVEFLLQAPADLAAAPVRTRQPHGAKLRAG